MKNKAFVVQFVSSLRQLEDYINTNNIERNDIVEVKDDKQNEGYYLLCYK